jgi:hypothetical protein
MQNYTYDGIWAVLVSNFKAEMSGIGVFFTDMGVTSSLNASSGNLAYKEQHCTRLIVLLQTITSSSLTYLVK